MRCLGLSSAFRGKLMVPLALGMFIAIFVFGANLLGWYDPESKVRLGLTMSFLFGVISGYRVRK